MSWSVFTKTPQTKSGEEGEENKRLTTSLYIKPSHTENVGLDEAISGQLFKTSLFLSRLHDDVCALDMTKLILSVHYSFYTDADQHRKYNQPQQQSR